MPLAMTIEGTLLERARVQAQREERNVSQLVRYALRKYLDAAEPAKAQAGIVTP